MRNLLYRKNWMILSLRSLSPLRLCGKIFILNFVTKDQIYRRDKEVAEVKEAKLSYMERMQWMFLIDQRMDWKKHQIHPPFFDSLIPIESSRANLDQNPSFRPNEDTLKEFHQTFFPYAFPRASF